jgi:membrane protease YdiL (CAAX protease family)
LTKKSTKHLWESFGILILVIAAIRGFYELRAVSWFAAYVPLAVAVILIYVPILHGGIRKERINYLDRSFKDYGRSFRCFFISVVLVLPPFLVANQFWQEMVFNKVFMPQMIPSLGLLIADQLLLVSIPEELFFRGWFQSRMNSLFEPKWNIFGIRLGWSWLLTALVFAAAHSVINYQWWHFAIFFPGLLFGWLREKTGSITAASLWHCLGNIAVYWIGISYT